jgi:excisionase family DNA binding protein
MGYSLGEAAKELGVSKPTVQRAIKAGRLSATRREDGSYDIDPAELCRAFPAVTSGRNVTDDLQRHETAHDTRVLQAELTDCGPDQRRHRCGAGRGDGLAKPPSRGGLPADFL